MEVEQTRSKHFGERGHVVVIESAHVAEDIEKELSHLLLRDEDPGHVADEVLRHKVVEVTKLVEEDGRDGGGGASLSAENDAVHEWKDCVCMCFINPLCMRKSVTVVCLSVYICACARVLQ